MVSLSATQAGAHIIRLGMLIWNSSRSGICNEEARCRDYGCLYTACLSILCSTPCHDSLITRFTENCCNGFKVELEKFITYSTI